MSNYSIAPALPDLESLSLAEQVAQMFVVRASGHLFDHQIPFPDWEPPAAKLQHWLQDLGVGGVILVGGSAGDLMLRSRQLQSWAKFPLLIAADVEEGVGHRFAGATWFPPPMAIGAIASSDPDKAQHYAEQMGEFTAKEALAIGLNWVLAPVVDVNNNPDNPVINVRSFGQTPATVSSLATAFIRGAHRCPVLTCAKHFPGHGDTDVDSHLDLPVLPHTSARLAEIELPPFAAAIAAGVDSIMSAHLLIKSWDPERPATLSHKILTGELRQKLGFEGLIVTDALVMGAIANKYGPNEAPILALEAGADILLMPVDPAGAIQAVCDAVDSGRISIAQIQDSVKRILKAKRQIGVGAEEQGSRGTLEIPQSKIQNPLDELATPEAIATSVNILRDSLKVGGSVPLQPAQSTTGGQLRNLILVDDLLRCDFLGYHRAAIAVPNKLGYQHQVVDRHTAPALFHTETGRLPPQPTLLQLFIRGNPFGGSAELIAVAQELFKKLLQTGELQGFVVYGSPYVVEQFLPKLPPEMPYVFSYGQLPVAQAIALQALFGVGAEGS